MIDTVDVDTFKQDFDEWSRKNCKALYNDFVERKENASIVEREDFKNDHYGIDLYNPKRKEFGGNKIMFGVGETSNDYPYIISDVTALNDTITTYDDAYKDPSKFEEFLADLAAIGGPDFNVNDYIVPEFEDDDQAFYDLINEIKDNVTDCTISDWADEMDYFIKFADIGEELHLLCIGTNFGVIIKILDRVTNIHSQVNNIYEFHCDGVFSEKIGIKDHYSEIDCTVTCKSTNEIVNCFRQLASFLSNQTDYRHRKCGEELEKCLNDF